VNSSGVNKVVGIMINVLIGGSRARRRHVEATKYFVKNKTAPAWLKMQKADVEEHIVKLAKKVFIDFFRNAVGQTKKTFWSTVLSMDLFLSEKRCGTPAPIYVTMKTLTRIHNMEI